MSQSKKYAKVKDYYERGLWDIRKVYDAVVHKKSQDMISTTARRHK